MRILWIDDEVDLLKPYVYFLKDKGYEVEMASNGPDGIALARSKNFDLVLLDEMMVGMDGLSVLQALKEYDPNILVAMVTKVSEEQLMNKAFGQLVDDFIIKPFTPAQILAVLKRLIEKKELISERFRREFVQISQKRQLIKHYQDWIDYYIMLLNWQSNLERFGDDVLIQSFAEEKLESNKEFAKYIERVYPKWLKGSGPILSHRFFEHFVIPHLGKKPIYLFLFDSMCLCQWFNLVPLLKEHYQVDTHYYYSILPTATPYSRNALFSGLLPLEIYQKNPRYWVFEDTGQNRYEEELLIDNLTRHGFKEKILYLKTSRNEDIQTDLNSILGSNVKFSVIILNFLDLLIHSIKTQRLLDEIIANEQSLMNLTRIWFSNSSVFNLLKALKNKDCKIIITSDHGFIKVNRPTLIYGGREISPNLRYKYGGALKIDEKTAILINQPNDYMLPTEHLGIRFAIAKSDYYFIYPTKPKEYEQTYKYSYQHGGVSLDEMILPVAFLHPR
ncbi:MAG: response regulator [candidate division WOR-3 bacterium]